jgi:type I restriction enzyme S subunit
MNSSWIAKAIGDAPIHIGDGNYSSKYPKSSEFVKNGIPFITASDFRNGRISSANFRYISPELHATLTKGHLRAGDVLLVTRGNGLGTVAFVDKEFEGANINAQLVLLRPVNTEVDPRFLYYLLSSSNYQGVFKSYASGSAQPQLPINSLVHIKLTYPSSNEQRAIAHILGSLDDKIELNRRMNETLEVTARALFKSWFVDFDPVHSKARGEQPPGLDMETAALFPASFEESELGMIPAGWRVKQLDEIATYTNGLALQKYPPNDENDYLPVIKIRELRQGNADNNSDKASTDIGAAFIVDDGDVLFSWSGSLLVDLWTGGRGALNQHLFKVTSAQYPRWLYYFWTLAYLDNFIDIAADKATTMGHIKRHHLSESLVVVPNDDVLPYVTEQIEPYIDAIVNNRVNSRTLAEIRDALLPKLVSGELRVGEVDLNADIGLS